MYFLYLYFYAMTDKKVTDEVKKKKKRRRKKTVEVVEKDLTDPDLLTWKKEETSISVPEKDATASPLLENNPEVVAENIWNNLGISDISAYIASMKKKSSPIHIPLVDQEESKKVEEVIAWDTPADVWLVEEVSETHPPEDSSSELVPDKVLEEVPVLNDWVIDENLVIPDEEDIDIPDIILDEELTPDIAVSDDMPVAWEPVLPDDIVIDNNTFRETPAAVEEPVSDTWFLPESWEATDTVSWTEPEHLDPSSIDLPQTLQEDSPQKEWAEEYDMVVQAEQDPTPIDMVSASQEPEQTIDISDIALEEIKEPPHQDSPLDIFKDGVDTVFHTHLHDQLEPLVVEPVQQASTEISSPITAGVLSSSSLQQLSALSSWWPWIWKEQVKKNSSKRILLLIAEIILPLLVLAAAYWVYKIMFSATDITPGSELSLPLPSGNVVQAPIVASGTLAVTGDAPIPSQEQQQKADQTGSWKLAEEENWSSKYTMDELQSLMRQYIKESETLMEQTLYKENLDALKLLSLIQQKSSFMLNKIQSQPDALTIEEIEQAVRRIEWYMKNAKELVY